MPIDQSHQSSTSHISGSEAKTDQKKAWMNFTVI